ncbi:DUF2501 domain-containing protein [Comamonas sp. Y33R10-2]|uniref:DUF2501 domain-containing protein n=1 Tax=Comamonas sp. Y33R10-2 TaxID=2853257 RepID=UPI001C5CC1DC|nr:DUF2501 domain-containing protein [Comamonas sp. Y33R10-2]QXZ09261.1 DUF2501 domain-containing protein [Comamonas sp. Y33R10-2]
MKSTIASALITAALAGATFSAQASGWGDALKEGASRLGAGSNSAGSAPSDSGSSGLGALGGLVGGGSSGSGAGSGIAGAGLAALGLGGLSGSGTVSNAAGVLTYCMKNNYLNADKATQIKDQLLGKLGLGQKEEPKDTGYQNGLLGMVTGSDGKSFSLDKVKSSVKEKACDFVLNNAKSLL